jgi:hypothetical protein
MVQYEPWLVRDKVMIDQLKSIGIEKGKPFQPDAKTQEILEEAAAEVRAWVHRTLLVSCPKNQLTRRIRPRMNRVNTAVLRLC